MLPPRDVGCRGVPAGAVGPGRHGVALRPVEGVPEEVLTQKYLWGNSVPGNKLPHRVCRPVPWNAILFVQTLRWLNGLKSTLSYYNLVSRECNALP